MIETISEEACMLDLLDRLQINFKKYVMRTKGNHVQRHKEEYKNAISPILKWNIEYWILKREYWILKRILKWNRYYWNINFKVENIV